MSVSAHPRRPRPWQVLTACVAAIVVGIGVAGGGVLGAWQGLSENATNMVTAAAAASAVPVTSVHCSGLTPAYPTTCTDAQGTVTISWTAVPGSTGITVRRATTPAGPYSTIATLAGSAITYTDSTAAYNTQYYYEVYSGTLSWMPAPDVDMALSLPPTGGTDHSAGTGGTAFTTANLTAMATAGGAAYTATTNWGGTAAQEIGGDQGNGVSCASATQCWVVSQDRSIWATSDGGWSWTQQATEGGSTLQGVDCISTTQCWAVGGTHEDIYATADGGSTWTAQHSHPGATFYGVEFSTASDGWAVGSGGVIFATTDGGTTWRTQTSPTGQQLNDIVCAAATSCWAVGNGGTIIATTNGNTWSVETSGTGQSLGDVSCPSATTCFAVGSNGTILVTTDGGTTWSSQTSGTAQQLNGIACVSTTQCTAAGANGTILTTSNGGTTWTSESSGTTQTLLDVSCGSATSCLAIGNGGTIAVGSGGNWVDPSAQYALWTFSPTVAAGTPVTSAIVTLVDSGNPAPTGATTTALMVSPNGGATWTSFSVANATPALAVQRVGITSVINGASAVSGLELRYVVTNSNGFTSTFDLVHVDIN
jgi:photosystem II stability/assembly factor-like uncharacterized protein